MRDTSYMRIPFYLACRTGGLAGPPWYTWGYFLSNHANQREPDSNNFDSFSKFLTSEKKGSDRFVKNRKANFGSLIEWTGLFWSAETEMGLSFDFDRNFRDLWHNENTSGLHVLVHYSMASEVVEIFLLFLDFFQLGRYYRKDIFPILLFW